MTQKSTSFKLLYIGAALAVAAGASGGIVNPAANHAAAGAQGDPAISEAADSLEFQAWLAAEEMRRLDSIARVDSIETVLTDSLNTVASDAYKNLKFVQYDGITEADLYPKVMTTYGNILEALAAPKLTDADRRRYVAALTDIGPMLMRGSMFYSSQRDDARFYGFAKSYVDLTRNPLMEGSSLIASDQRAYVTLIYASAASAYNSGDYASAADYLEMYLLSEDKTYRENVMTFLGQASVNTGQGARFADLLLKGTEEFPANYNLLLLTLQNCLDAGDTERMKPVVDKALTLRPDDEQLLNIRGRLFEKDGEYADAMSCFEQLAQKRPDSLPVFRHLALCYYNLGVGYYNKALLENDEKLHDRYMRQSDAYFSTAAQKLQRLVDNDTSEHTYLEPLAMSYARLGRRQNLDEVNGLLMALGRQPVKINDMPKALVTENSADGKSGAARMEEIPDFQTFSVDIVTSRLNQWCQIREFEKRADFEKRVNENSIREQHRSISKEAEQMYLDKYARKFRISDMKLLPYDAENECYKIQSTMGDFVVRVPLKNREAEMFKSQWETTQVRSPKYIIKDNRPAIAGLTLVTMGGKSYTYTSDMAESYDYTPVRVDLNGILAANMGANAHSSDTPHRMEANVIRAKSDVDENIPVTSYKADKTLALIIANENYSKVTGVESALQDGETFMKYCTHTLGIPRHQVIYRPDITLGDMLESVSQLRRMAANLGDGVDVLVYYAGHGFPDEASKDAFLLPVDGNGISTATAYSLRKFYADLADTGAENVMVFLDACFSGAARDGDMLVKARGVALKPKSAAPAGNMFVLSATSESETAMPYREKHHGLFTYYLLKKLQQSKGNVSLKELADYVTTNVKRMSIPVNQKQQNPRYMVSGTLADTWHKKKLRD